MGSQPVASGVIDLLCDRCQRHNPFATPLHSAAGLAGFRFAVVAGVLRPTGAELAALFGAHDIEYAQGSNWLSRLESASDDAVERLRVREARFAIN